MNPQSFLQLDRIIHEKGRLAIMSMLAAAPELSFTEMRDALGMTDGNLTTHIRTLQELPAKRPSPITSICWRRSSSKPRVSKIILNENGIEPSDNFVMQSEHEASS